MYIYIYIYICIYIYINIYYTYIHESSRTESIGRGAQGQWAIV